MADPARLVTEEQRRQAIGLESAPTPFEVEKGHIFRFADAVGDSNPLWTDERAARRSRYGGLIAPPTFLRAAPVAVRLPFDPPARWLDGGNDWEYFRPLHPGDRITCIARVEDVYERSGRLGPMLFVIIQTRYLNQIDELIAAQRITDIYY